MSPTSRHKKAPQLALYTSGFLTVLLLLLLSACGTGGADLFVSRTTGGSSVGGGTASVGGGGGTSTSGSSSSSGTGTPTSAVSVSISPSSATINAGTTQAFSATVTGD